MFKYSSLTQGSRVCSSVRGGGGSGKPFGEVSWGWGMGVDWGGEERGSACAQLRFVHEVASLTVHKGLSALRPSGGGC